MRVKEMLCEDLREAEDILAEVRRKLQELPQGDLEIQAALNCISMACNATEETRTWLQ